MTWRDDMDAVRRLVLAWVVGLCAAALSACPEPAQPLVILECPAGEFACGTSCIDVSNNASHCGECGRACAAGETCEDGACISSAIGCNPPCEPGETCQAGICTEIPLQCGVSQIQCGTDCVNPANSQTNCGASGDCSGANAGVECGQNEFCDDGTCAAGCAAGLVDCAGNCIDPQTDNTYCGASADCAGDTAGVTCVGTENCTLGACVSDCNLPNLDCDGACIDPQTDVTYCGATDDCQGDNVGVTCGAGEECDGGACVEACAPPNLVCEGTCIDPQTDNTYCGAGGDCSGASAGVTCDAGAGESCQNGVCETGCVAPNVDCQGNCINPLSDLTYCGASDDCAGGNAGVTCQSGETCDNGSCVLDCQAPSVVCDGSCIDPQTNGTYCGASGDCAGGNVGVTCQNGESCVDGTCQAGCDAPNLVCGGNCINPQQDDTYCGATGDCMAGNEGVTCQNGESCVDGNCVADCQAPNIVCGGNCVDPQTDGTYCGATGDCMAGNEGVTCQNGESCVDGNCVADCQAPNIVCGGNCVDPQTDGTYCGATGDCMAGNEGVTCQNGESCVDGNCVADCQAPNIVCGGNCVDPQTDGTYCGATGDCMAGNEGVTCQGLETCLTGGCTCEAPNIVCGGNCIDPQTDGTYCGATGDCMSGNEGVTCGAAETCVSGFCTGP